MFRDRPNRPRYVPNTTKALEVILWLAGRHPTIDIYHLVKAAFYADKHHVAEYGRPIIGDLYEADTYGPLPKVVYGLLCHSPIEVLALGNNGPLPFAVDDAFRVIPSRDANLARLSESDQEALEQGLVIVKNKSFDDLVDMTHDESAYVNAEGGLMDYRDFIPDDDPDRDEKAEDMAEVARYAVF